jgi:16S rRNA (adenine(1408)-N(1))-methyltransferase
VIVDVGTGDGRAVLARAASAPETLVIGVDANASAMAEASRRADRRGPRNALFLAAGAEALAESPLAGNAGLVTVQFPWGSLLRGVLGLDADAMLGVAALPCRGGRIDALVSVTSTDRVEGMELLDDRAEPAIRRAWSAAGLELTTMRLATRAEIVSSGSTWGRRLGADRPVWRLEGTRSDSIGP